MTLQAGQQYKDPIGGTQSSIGDEQFEMFKWQKKALIQMAKDTVFGNLASTINMPKHMGKTIKRYEYIPMLDDANINDQGIDAAGLTTTLKKTIKLIAPEGSGVAGRENVYTTVYATGEDTVEATAITKAEAEAKAAIEAKLGASYADYAAAKTAAGNAGWLVVDSAQDSPVVPVSGNLYGSSKDVGTIAGKLPRLDENGGRKNRVGGRRIELEGTLELFGFFREWTRESLDFDTDAQLQEHMTREMMYAANEICEDMLQIDLLNAAGVVRFGGSAVSDATVSGNTGSVSLVTYEDLMRLSITLDDNRCDKDTKVISGSRMQDTRTIRATRIMYIGSELQPMIEKMTDLHGQPAFISVEKYADAGSALPGEIGKVGQFTIVVYREMMHWAGAGATVGTNAGYRETGGKYDIFPMLVVGNDSFNTIGFQTDSKGTSKFKIINKMPGSETADRQDPFGMVGFSSIQWYYGFLSVRPERIALVKTVAEM